MFDHLIVDLVHYVILIYNLSCAKFAVKIVVFLNEKS